MGNTRIVKNTVFLYILTFSNYFLGLILFPFLSRTLSVENFGLVGFSMSFVLIFQMIVEYGFSISATALISKNRQNKGEINSIVSDVLWSKVFLMIIALFIYLNCYVFIDMIRTNFLIVSLFLLDAFIKAFLPDFYFRGIEEMQTITIRTVIAKVLCLSLAVIFVRSNEELILVPISYIFGDLIALSITYYSMFQKGIKINISSFKKMRYLMTDGFLFFVSRLAVSINNSIGSFFLGLVFSPSSIQSGILAGITKVTTAGEMMLTPINDSIYPHMIKEKDYTLLKKIIIYGGIIWTIGCGIIFIFSDLVCSIILGPQYGTAGIYLRILLVNTYFAFYSIFLGYPALSPIGKSNYANAAIPIATIINLVMYLILFFSRNISLKNVLVVMATMNIIMVIFRSIVLYKNRKLIVKKV
jgi:O-antigen/teichoic acid export membrane protein